MPRSRTITAVCAVLAGLALAVPAAAQTISSPYRYIERGQEAGPVIGYMDTDPGRFGLGPKSAAFYGGSYAVALGGLVSLEGLVTITPSERDVVNPRVVDGDPVLPDPAAVLLVGISARLRFNLTGRRTWNGVQPYLMAGAGLLWDAEGTQLEDQALEIDERFSFGTQFSGIFGGGLRAVLTDEWALRGEYSLNLYQLDTPDGWRDPTLGLGDSPESEWINAQRFTLGASYLF